MATDNSKQKLIQFLDRRVWRPVLNAKPDGSATDRARLERVQRKTERQRERYQSYANAGQVRQEFRDDLHSQQAKKTTADLRKLHLPVQADVADEFFALADRLGVTPERLARRPHTPHPPHPWHKSKPEEREKAKQQLTEQARAGDKAAIETLRTAPQAWARDYAQQLTAGKPAGGSRTTRTSTKIRSAAATRKKRK